MKRAKSSHQFARAAALEAGTRNNVEYAVGPVTIGRRVSASLGFQIVDVLGVDLRADIAGDVGVGDGNAVDCPGDLVPATQMKLVVRDICAGDIIGDGIQAVAQVGAGGHSDFAPADD